MTESILRCPTCNAHHHEKTDVFGNKKGDKSDFDAREIFGVTYTCPISLMDTDELVALPCGHLLSKRAYSQMGGCISGVSLDEADGCDEDGGDDRALIHIRKAGQRSCEGTYRRHKRGNDAYTKIGQYDGQDVTYSIEVRTVDLKRWWYLSCDSSNPSEPRVDFYRAPVNDSCDYPKGVRWEAATLYGKFPSPRVAVSYFE